MVAVALGLVATLLAFLFIQNRDSQDRTPMTKVWSAAVDLQANQVVTPAHLKQIAVPKTDSTRDFLAMCFTDTPPREGQRVIRRIPAGAPVLITDFGESKDIELAGEARAMSIPCKGANALSGLLQPSRDYVKLFVTRPIANATAIAPVSATAPVEVSSSDPNPKIGVTGERASVYRAFQLVGGVPLKVLAVGAHLAHVRMQPTAADSYIAASQAENLQTVTLEVTEAQAKEILEQTAAGMYQVTLILCPPPKQVADK